MLKSFIAIATFLIFPHNLVFSQGTRVEVDSVTSYVIRGNHHKRAIGTKIGEGLLIGGGALVVAGGGIALANSGPRGGGGGDIAGGVIAIVGLDVAFYGAICFICGKLHEKHHPERFSLIGSNNQLGLAWNF